MCHLSTFRLIIISAKSTTKLRLEVGQCHLVTILDLATLDSTLKRLLMIEQGHHETLVQTMLRVKLCEQSQCPLLKHQNHQCTNMKWIKLNWIIYMTPLGQKSLARVMIIGGKTASPFPLRCRTSLMYISSFATKLSTDPTSSKLHSYCTSPLPFPLLSTTRQFWLRPCFVDVDNKVERRTEVLLSHEVCSFHRILRAELRKCLCDLFE